MISSLNMSLPWLITVMLLSVRVGTLLLMTPVLEALAVPPLIRIVLIFSLAVVLAVGFPQLRASVPMGFGSLVLAVVTELALGATMAIGILVAFAAFSIGGRLLDVQIGHGIAQVFDPITRRQLPILTSVLNQIAIVVFFLGNFHHTLLRGLAYSLESCPPGRPWSLAIATAPVLKHVSSLFVLGFMLVAPVVFFFLMLEFALGVLTRNLPQMQMFALGIPLKILLGFVALLIWFGTSNGMMERVYGSIFQTWEAVFLHG